ncbi:MAG: endonuclease/exonuclease/phosphatase family protein [Planctomycetes bacterium]|nr:endonuclease/exonuclease/phosphatase family protein [Planctomycetota bacterium]
MRLLTYNIHKGIGGRDRRYDLSRIIDVIKAENPDLVFLQEVDRHVTRSHVHDQPRLIAEALALPHQQYQLNVHVKHGGYGNMLLSRWPFGSHHSISLRYQTKKPRAAQVAVIQTPDGPLQAVNWHLGLSEAERLWQAQRLLGHHLFLEGSKLPALVAGDFNDWRNTLAGGLLSKHGFTQLTTPISSFRSFPAYFAVGSLDKAFARGLIAPAAHIFRGSKATVASDHLPLVVDFKIK